MSDDIDVDHDILLDEISDLRSEIDTLENEKKDLEEKIDKLEDEIISLKETIEIFDKYKLLDGNYLEHDCMFYADCKKYRETFEEIIDVIDTINMINNKKIKIGFLYNSLSNTEHKYDLHKLIELCNMEKKIIINIDSDNEISLMNSNEINTIKTMLNLAIKYYESIINEKIG